MEPPHLTHNQAGPSNFPNVYAHDARAPAQFTYGRGRPNNGYRNVKPNGGYPTAVNGMNNAPLNNHYNHGHGGIPSSRRAGPTPQSMNYQAPGSPALHPAHVYSSHPVPYLPSVPPQTSSPMYQYQHGLAHMQPFNPAFTPPLRRSPYSYPNHQNMNSPIMTALPEQAVDSLGLQKGYVSSQPAQLSPTPLLLQQQDKQSPPTPKHAADVSQDANPPPQSAVWQPTSPPSSEAHVSPVSGIQISLTQTPASTKIELTPSDDEPASQEWVIATYRPENPADAAGIMISPKAKPSAHILEGAVEHRLQAPPTMLLRKSLKKRVKDSVLRSSDLLIGSEGMSESDIALSHYEQMSGSGTETESRTSTVPDVFVLESPSSTATSASLAPPKPAEPVEKDSHGSSLSAPTVLNPEAESPKSFAAESGPSPVPSLSATPLPSIKKSWASLLRPDGSSNSRASLPMSSVIGFSVPAIGVELPLSSNTNSSAIHSGLLRLLTNGPNVGDSNPQIVPRGLVNTGNMCFANAVLQTLVYTPPFFRLFTELGVHIPGTGTKSMKWNGKTTPLVDATVDFLKEFKPKTKSTSKDRYEEDEFEGIDSFIPTYVYDAMKEKSRFDNMGGGQQEDAEEFFGFFLDTIEEELLSISNSLTQSPKLQAQGLDSVDDEWLEVGKKNKAVVTRTVKSVDSPMTRIFGGKFRSTLKVPGQRDSVMVEDWRSLQLDIQREQVNSIEDALRYISHPQQVQVSSVTKGGAPVDAIQQVFVEALPQILVLHLKRFLYDTNLKDVVKLHKQVAFGPELEIPLDAISVGRRNPHPDKYKLFAVLYHHGKSAAGGHYTLDVLHPNRNSNLNAKLREGWIRIDDELVSDLQEQDVFGSERDCAYLLFYRRVGKTYARAGKAHE
ncbi:hypothetical protein M0805_008973 [Coniferiporia weirii]|nr:hypothetical protein M0805_008973 [Coniferiporia weirii]